MEEKPYILELNIPLCPPRLDNLFRLHYHKRNKLIKEQHKLVHSLLIGKTIYPPLKKCTITIIRYCNRFLDYDNLVSCNKGFIDSLIPGVIFDDRYSITGIWNVSQEFRSKKEGFYTYIKIEGNR